MVPAIKRGKKKFQFTRIKMNVSNIITAQFKDFRDW